MRRNILFISTGFVLFVANAAIAAPNLIVNGGFENALASWNNVGFSAQSSRPGPVTPYAGLLFASNGCAAAGNCTLSQTFSTLANTSYHLSFAFTPGDSATDSTNASFRALINGTAITPDIGVGPNAYSIYNFDFMTTSLATTLTFAGFQAPEYSGLDQVSVTQNATVIATPGPVAGAGIPTLLGLAGLWAVRRRRQQSATVGHLRPGAQTEVAASPNSVAERIMFASHSY